MNRQKSIRYFFFVGVLIFGLVTVISSNYEGEKGIGDQITVHYGSSGTFTIEGDILTIEIDTSDLPPTMGYQPGVEVYTVKHVDDKTMTLIDKGEQESTWAVGDCVPRGTVYGCWVRRDGNKLYTIYFGEPNEENYISDKWRFLFCQGC